MSASSSASSEYEPVERSSHSTARVGDYLYLWGGVQPELPDAHDNNKKKSMSSVVEIYHLPTSTWEQKTTTGNPPLGVKGYACAVIGKEIFYFGGYCNHDYCYHNSLHSLNIDTLNWREIFPSNNEHGPMMKSFCGMVSIEIDGEDYLAVIGGYGASSNSPKQLGAQYSSSGAGYQHCNEIHYYKLSSDEWVSPTVTGDKLPPVDSFTLTSISNDSAVLFGGYTITGKSNGLYIISFTKTSVALYGINNFDEKSTKWPGKREHHSSVLISNTSLGPHLLVIGGVGYDDCWLLNIEKRIWRQLFNLPNAITHRCRHSISVWRITHNTNRIVLFGGRSGRSLVSATSVIELRYNNAAFDEWSISEIPLEKLQEGRKKFNKPIVVHSRPQVHLLNINRKEKRETEDLITYLQLEEFQQQEDRQIIEQQFQEQVAKLEEQLEERLYHNKEQLEEERLHHNREQLEEERLHHNKEQLEEERLHHNSELILVKMQLQEATALLKQSEITKSSLEQRNEHLQKELKEERQFLSSLIKQRQCKTDPLSETTKSLSSNCDEAKEEEERQVREELQQKIEVLQQQLQQVKDCKEVAVQFDYLIPHSDTLDSSITIAGQNLFLPRGYSPQSFHWEKYGFRMHCPEGAMSEGTEVAVTAIASGNFKVPKGTMLVSAVYAISISKKLLKPLVIELQHCVDLKSTSQTHYLKFVQSPLKSPHQFTPVDGGSFSVASRYGSIERDQFSFYAIISEINNEDFSSNDENESEGSSTSSDTDSEYGTPTQGSDNELDTVTNDSTLDDSPVQEDECTTEVAQVTETFYCEFKESDSIFEGRSSHNEAPTDEHFISPSLHNAVTVTHSDILYTGMMYHKEKKAGYWKTFYSVVKDLEVLKQYLREEHSNVEHDDIDTFKFIQPNGSLQLCMLETPQQPGWTVHPHKNPMKLLQSVMDKFEKNPKYSSCSMSVYAKPGIAQDPLHFPITLTGIIPETTIYINRLPPLPLPSSSMTGSTSASPPATGTNQMRDIAESAFISDVAYKVMVECTGVIKEKLSLNSLVDKLIEKRMINECEKSQVLDEHCGLTADQRMDKLLSFIKASIKEDGEDFGLFLEIIKQDNTRRADRLAQTLLDAYHRLL